MNAQCLAVLVAPGLRKRGLVSMVGRKAMRLSDNIPAPSASDRGAPRLPVDCEGTSAPRVSYDATVRLSDTYRPMENPRLPNP